MQHAARGAAARFCEPGDGGGMICVVAAVIERGGRLLICQRRLGGAFPLKWEFPGGKMRAGETPWEALTRELREELGVAARIGRELFRVRHRYAELRHPLQLSFFAASMETAQRWRNQEWPSAAGGAGTKMPFERVLWVKRGDLARYDFLRADRELVARLVRGEFADIGVLT
jgi:8-oxo-dGTP diphosphatase